MDLAEGWEVWNEEAGGQLVLAFRPDVFDASRFPAACLPTLTVARGRSPDELPERRARSARWFRALFLEPTVRVREADATYPSRADAVSGALELAAAFSAGRVDVTDVYQTPREGYVEALDALVGAGR